MGGASLHHRATHKEASPQHPNQRGEAACWTSFCAASRAVVPCRYSRMGYHPHEAGGPGSAHPHGGGLPAASVVRGGSPTGEEANRWSQRHNRPEQRLRRPPTTRSTSLWRRWWGGKSPGRRRCSRTPSDRGRVVFFSIAIVTGSSWDVRD